MRAARSIGSSGEFAALKTKAASVRWASRWPTDSAEWLSVSSDRLRAAGRWTSSMPRCRAGAVVVAARGAAVDDDAVPAVGQPLADLLDRGLEAAVAGGDASRPDHGDAHRSIRPFGRRRPGAAARARRSRAAITGSARGGPRNPVPADAVPPPG